MGFVVVAAEDLPSLLLDSSSRVGIIRECGSISRVSQWVRLVDDDDDDRVVYKWKAGSNGILLKKNVTG